MIKLLFLITGQRNSIMQSKQPQRPKDQQSVLQAYSLFESNQSYLLKFAGFKKKIQNSDHHFIITMVRALKLVLSSGGRLGSSEIVAAEKLTATKNTKEITLSEYSKLLALRFIRETYFDSNYLYMTHVLLYLSSLLLKIALFKKESNDEERGKHLFAPDSKAFLGETKFVQGKEKELEVIGFSVHKITLEIMFGSKDFVQCLPCHEEFQIGKNEARQSMFFNQMYAGYLLLKENFVKFPTKFHYFKEKDIAKYMAYYQKNSNTAQIKEFYLKIFEEVQAHLLTAIGPLSALGFITTDVVFIDILDELLQEKLLFCEQLVLETCDRFFWKHFNEFTAKKISQFISFIEKGQPIVDKQLKEISSIYLFLLFFSYRLLQPQIMYVIEHSYIEKLAYLFVVIMRSYGRISENKQKKVTFQRVLICLIDCFTKLKQISVKFVNTFNQKNISHNYHLISFYSDIAMQIEIIGTKMPLLPFTSEVERKIIDRMDRNHENHFSKQQFLFHYYEKKEQPLIKTPKQGVVNLFKEVMGKYSKYLRTKPKIARQQMIEQVTIEKQEITKEELHVTHLSEKSSSIRSSFRLRVVSSQKNQFTPQKQSLPQVKSAITLMKRPNDGKVPSFIESLKVKINKPNDQLVKSLSSSRKLRRSSNDSSSQFKSFRSNDHSDNSQTSLFLVQANAIPPFSTPPEFKHVFIDNNDLPVFQQPLESRFSARKSPSKLQRVSRVNEIANTKYINNFIAERKETESKKIIQDYYEQAVKEIKEKEFERKVETEYMPICELKSQKIQSLSSMSSLEKLSFYFTPKVKKQLLKKKVLIRKNQRFEIGMIANLQQQITTNQTQTIRKYLLLIKVYVTTFLPMARVNVDVKMPNWLVCISKANLSKEGLKEQTQIISNFVVMLKASRQHVPNRNYGEMPMLNVVWTDKTDKKEVLSQPLYILLNRFAIERVVTENEFNQGILRSLTINDPLPVHEKIAVDLKGIRNYYSSLSIFSIDISQKMQIFSSMDSTISDQLGVVKLELIRNRQELMLIFFQGERGKLRLFVQFHPLKPQQWNYEQLHIFQTCLRSILRADQ